MGTQGTHKAVYAAAMGIAVAGGVVATLIGGFLKVPAGSTLLKFPLIEWAVTLAHSWGPLVLVSVTLLVSLSQIARHFFGNPWVWEQIEVVLNQLQEHAFNPDYRDEPRNHHRATLFIYKKYKYWIWPWRGWTPWGGARRPCSGWLAPVSRSGHTTQKSTALFLASDEGKVEGVAGRTWACAAVITMLNLPIIDSKSSDEDIAEYAKQIWVSPEFIKDRIKKGRMCPSSLMGIPVMSGSRPIAVVVLDSLQPDGIKSAEQLFVATRTAQAMLVKLLLRL